jgi:MYXO-CTERM domain-containing protein
MGVLLMAAALAVGVVSKANAATITINTDTSWLATNVAPPVGWNTNPLFNTAGWTNAFVSTVTPAPCFNGADCIWFDDQNSATQFAWLRQTFTISGPILTAFLDGGVDDDADIFINGFLVYSVHDGLAGNFGPSPLNVAPFLVQGTNLIAVSASDNFGFGHNHLFVAQLEIDTPTEVPEPFTFALLAPGLAALAGLRRRRRSQA